MVLHIVGQDEWRPGTELRPAGDVGFLHCSDPGTVHLPANRLFAGRTDLLLLEIDPALLDVPVRWEPGVPPDPAGIWFPHVYGPVPAAAVVAVHDFPLPADGVFRPPDSVARRE